jgi:hypothetical protein
MAMWRRRRNRTGYLIGAAALAALLVVPAIPSVRRYVRMKRM